MSLSSLSLGDKYALYLDSLAAQIRPHWQSVLNQLLTLSSVTTLSSDLSSLLSSSSLSPSSSSSLITPILTTLILASIVILIIIMAWHSPLTNLLRRSSPYTSVANPPYISDQDYSYISPDEADANRPRYETNRYAADSADSDSEEEDNRPDTLLLKHRKHTYELHFPAYAINDGTLTVGQLRKRAAEVTRTRDPQRIVLLYKGEILHRDAVPCRAEGLKQNSEVLCVVSEVEPGEGTPSEGSEVEIPVKSRSGGVGLDGAEQQQQQQQQQPPPQTRVRNRTRNKGKNKKKLTKKAKDNKDPTTGPPPPPTAPARPAPTTGGSGSSSMPPPAPNLKNFSTAREQVEALRDYLRRELVPPCEAYARSPPQEEKVRVFENRKLSETILAQVILKADGIEPSGDAETRAARKTLINEAQAALGLLDRVG